MNRFKKISFIFLLVLILVQCSPAPSESKEKIPNTETETESVSNSNSIFKIDIKLWKDTPHISGTTATDADVESGKAAFQFDNNRSMAMDLQVPSFVLHRNNETNEEKYAILIQAEEIGDKQLAGIRFLDGQITACLMENLTFIDEADIDLNALMNN